jgi:hypothetical protein
MKKLISKINHTQTCECNSYLEYAIITSPEIIEKNINPQVKRILLSKYMY